jgi:hypothetical protein
MSFTENTEAIFGLKVPFSMPFMSRRLYILIWANFEAF